MSVKNKVPLIDGLFTWPSDQPRLIASQCRKCSALAFPRSQYCTNPDCTKDKANIEIVELANRAKLHTWTVQIYPPAPPFKLEPFEPFPVGMLDLPEGLRVLGMLTTDKVEIGMEMEMTTKKLFEDEENEYLTWVWKPVAQGK